MEQVLIGTPVADPENPIEVVRVVRSFDPCLACAVHLVTADGGRDYGTLREVLRAAELLGIKPEVVIIGIEPERIAPGLELSPAVEAALPRAVALVLEELQTQT